MAEFFLEKPEGRNDQEVSAEYKKSRVGQIALVFRSDHPIDQRSMSADLIEIIFCDLIVDRIDTIYCPL